MRITKIGLLSSQLLFFAVIGSAQSLLELKPVETVRVPNQTASGIFEPIKCDSNSNIYAQLLHESDPPGQTPVTKLSPDGKPSVFPLPRLDDKKLGILDFAPGGDGGVMLLTTDYDAHYYVESYDEHGRFDSRFTLPDEVDPMQIAVSPRGKVLVCGLWLSAAPGGSEKISRPYAAVFGSAGRLEREVVLTQETQVSESKATSAGPESGRAESDGRRTISFSSAQFSASEGFVLARLGSEGSIYTITPDGLETKRLHLSPPPESRLTNVKVDRNTIAALFVWKEEGSTQNEISDVFVSLIDSQTGDEQQRFHHSSWQLGAALACYKEGVFTFLRTGDNDELQIVRAAAK